MGCLGQVTDRGQIGRWLPQRLTNQNTAANGRFEHRGFLELIINLSRYAIEMYERGENCLALLYLQALTVRLRPVPVAGSLCQYDDAFGLSDPGCRNNVRENKD